MWIQFFKSKLMKILVLLLNVMIDQMSCKWKKWSQLHLCQSRIILNVSITWKKWKVNHHFTTFTNWWKPLMIPRIKKVYALGVSNTISLIFRLLTHFFKLNKL
jgi:hypothetical protein